MNAQTFIREDLKHKIDTIEIVYLYKKQKYESTFFFNLFMQYVNQDD